MTKLKTELAKDIKDDAVDAIEATENFVLRARNTIVPVARRGALAYVGMFGMAYDMAAKRVSKLTEGREELFADLVKRGETLEAKAGVVAKDTQTKVVKFASEGTDKVRAAVPSFVPGAANDRVEELEGEVEKLSKKIKALNAKTSKATKTTTKKTTAKKAA